MRKLLNGCLSFVGHAFWVFLLVLAVYVTAGRQFFPAVSQLKGSLEQFLTEKSGAKVTIESLKADWKGFDPIIRLSGLIIHPLASPLSVESPPPIGVLQRLYVKFSFWDSLKHFKFRFDTIRVQGLSLRLQQQNEGQWQLPGLSFNSENAGAVKKDDAVFNWQTYFSPPVIDFSDVSLHLKSRLGKKTDWVIPHAMSVYEGGNFLASGRASPPENTSDFLQFSMKGKSGLLTGGFSGELYLKWSSGQFLNPYLSVYQWDDIKVTSLDVKGQMWLNWSEGILNAIQGDLAFPYITLNAKGTEIAPIESLSTRFFWHKEDKLSRLLFTDLSFKWLDKQWPISHYEINVDAEKDTEVRGDQLDLGTISSLVQALNILPTWGNKSLASYQPKGLLKNIHLSIPPSNEFLLSADMFNLSTQSVNSAPAVKGVDGLIEVDANGGRVKVVSNRFAMAFPSLFREGWTFSRSELEVGWSMGPQLDIFSKGIRLEQGDKGKIFADFDLSLSDDSDEEFIALKIGFKDVDATLAPGFVPFNDKDDSLDRWLRTSIKGGHISEGLYLGYGAIGLTAPSHNFTSSLYLDISQGRLKFDENWPELTDLNARLLLQNAGLTIDKGKAIFEGMPLYDVKASLPEHVSKPKLNILKISAKADPKLNDVDYWLKKSPVSLNTKEHANDFDVKGLFSAEVNLQIPMSKKAGELNYDVELAIKEGDVLAKSTNLNFSQLNGRVSINNRGVFADKVQLAFQGRPAILNVYPKVRGDGEVEQRIQLLSDMSLDNVYRYFNIDPVKQVQGEIQFDALLSLPVKNNPLHLAIHSDLNGVKSDYPAPFNKPISEVAPVVLDIFFSGNSTDLQLQYNKYTKGRFLFDGGEFKRGVLAMSDTLSSLPAKGLKINLDVASLEVAPWVELGKQLANETQAIVKAPESTGSLYVHPIAISTKDLDFYGQHFSNVAMMLSQSKSASASTLNINLAGDQIAGAIKVPPVGQVIEASLKKLHLIVPDSENPNLSNAKANTKSELSPFDIPEINFKTDEFWINNKPYGAWSFQTEVSDQGVAFKSIEGKIDDSTFKGHLNWSQSEAADHIKSQNSILTGKVEGGDAAPLLKALGWPPSFSSKSVSTELAFTWGGSPLDFSIAKVSGKVDLRLEDGQINESQRATDALKIFGILNADAIERRLKLDFSDLYKKGVSYDKIEGVARIEEGVLRLEEPLAFQGPSNSFKFTGSADLVTHNLDMKMVVVLPVTKNLPLAAIVLGAPQIGGALWIIDKLLGEPLSRLTSATYSLKGDWDKPEIKLDNVFDRTSSKKGEVKTKDTKHKEDF